MVGQKRPSRSCSILIWGGFLLLYAALTAIIDCTQSNGTSTTIVPLPFKEKILSYTTQANTENNYGSGDGPVIVSTQLSLQNENNITESSTVIILFKIIFFLLHTVLDLRLNRTVKFKFICETTKVLFFHDM